MAGAFSIHKHNMQKKQHVLLESTNYHMYCLDIVSMRWFHCLPFWKTLQLAVLSGQVPNERGPGCCFLKDFLRPQR